MSAPTIVAPPVWYCLFWLGFLSLYCAYWNWHDGKALSVTAFLLVLGVTLVISVLRNQLR